MERGNGAVLPEVEGDGVAQLRVLAQGEGREWIGGRTGGKLRN